ncbi:unnamed protein product [Arctia plantaginis]|uniref:Uncharacterized protein n=1 Tax=Arctia plantaginis TaxID=874455 RepID=A0A8S0YQI4_ARCPL|nr:unnamed protein product [Arctia plantaginis]
MLQYTTVSYGRSDQKKNFRTPFAKILCCRNQSNKMLTFLRSAIRRSLKTHPILTHTAVYATFYAAADISQKTFKRLQYVDNAQKPEYKLIETAKLAAVGSSIYAPTLFYWYVY